MANCNSCGSQLRDGAEFCPSCGAAVSAANTASDNYDFTSNADRTRTASDASDASETQIATVVPLITFAPIENSFSKQRILRYSKAAIIGVAVILVALIAAAGAAYFSTNPFKTSSFEAVEDTSYRKCLSLVGDVRNSNFDDIIEDLINMSGAAEDYNFLKEYERLFKEFVPDDSGETAVKFRNCCFMVSYAEFTAKKYKNFSQDWLTGWLYTEDADRYRGYADELWDMLNNAKTDDELQAIIDYCAEKDIIYLK